MEVIFIILAVVLALFLVFIWLVSPNTKRDIPIAKAYAHRGLHGGDIPENSLASFRAAAQKGYGVEFDVQLTKDKKLVVFHDDSLFRMTGSEGTISDLTYMELCKYRLNDTNEKIPLLEEALAVLDGLPILCEIKKQGGDTNVEICPYIVAKLDEYPGDICIESFSPFILRWLVKNRPDFARGQLSGNFFKIKSELNPVSVFIVTNLLLNFLSRPDFIAYRYIDTSVGFFFCKKFFHTPLLGWTPRGDKQRELCRNNFFGEIFEL